MLFKNFFVVSGGGASRNSSLTAFDRALFKAGIAQCNLVQVSSILPEGAMQVKPAKIEPGSVTFTVMSREDGLHGEEITAGIGWAHCKVNGKDSYGIVVEDHGKKTVEECRRDLRIKLEEMAEARKMDIAEYDIEIAHMNDIPQNTFGCVAAALIYVNEK